MKAVTGKEEKGEGTLTIDESKRPKWITLTGTSGAQAGGTFAAIYSLDGDTLKLAYRTGKNNETRPNDFNEGRGQALEVLGRVKP